MNTEFQNQNTFRNYPFRENMPLIDVTSALTLLPGLFVDFVVYGIQPGRQYYLTRTVWEAVTKKITFYFQDDQGDGFSYTHLYVFGYPVQNRPTYVVRSFISTDLKVAGRIVLNASIIQDLWYPFLSDVTHNFTLMSTALEQGVVVPEEPAVMSLQKFGDPYLFQGFPKLKEGYNIKITKDSEGNALEINAIKGAGLGESCHELSICNRKVDKDGDGVNEILCGQKKAIMTINKQAPDDSCSMFVLGDDCLRIIKYPVQKMVAIHNECTNGCDVAALIEEIRCRICLLKVKFGMLPGPCDCEGVEFQNAPQLQPIPAD